MRISETAADLLVDASMISRSVLGGKSCDLTDILKKFVSFKHLKST